MLRSRFAWLLVVLCIGCGQASETEPRVTVFAAASLRDVMEELAPLLGEAAGGEVVLNFAGSNVLARQIEASGEADVILSASEEWLDRLEAAGRLVPGSRRAFLSNRLVVVARHDSGVEVAAARDLASAEYRYLSIGDPRGVPAGVYARGFLEAVAMPGGGTLWQAVEERVAPAPDVRAALAQVAARRDVVGIVYATDAHAAGEVKVLFEVPPELAPEIVYGAAAVAGGPAGEAAARAVLDALASSEARAVFSRHGFAAPSGGEGGAG
jgi:molybdate transport system substrate-binding protein